MSMMLPNLAAITGTPIERIRLHARDVGGGFGIRSQAYPEYCAVMLAAKRLGRPVKWVGSRFETIVSDHHGRGVRLSGALALDREGRFLGLRFDWVCNMGAYLSQPGPLISTRNPSTHAINAYAIPALYGRHRLAMTNTTPTTAYRGAGRPNVTYLVERLVDEAARKTGVDRVELRRRNLIPKEAYPYKTPTSTYDSGDPPGLLEKAVRFSEWHSFPKRKEESLKKNRLRGLGLAMFVEPSGGGIVTTQEAAIKFGDSGNAVLHTVSGSSGQGHETVFPEIVGRIFGLPVERISLKAGETMMQGGGTVGSRSVMSHGGALLKAAEEAVRKGLDLAAKDLEVASADLEFSQGRYRVKGTDLGVDLEELARRHRGALDTTASIPAPLSFPAGAHVVEVEIDRESGAVEVASYVAVDDCGNVINHTLMEGQLHGGIAQGIGQVLAEHCVYEEDSGQLLTGTFMDYAMPRASDQPRSLALHDHPVPSPSNPLGAKGAGEAGTTGAIPAVANAVIDALRPLGIDHLDFPCTSARIWEAMRKARAGG
jgi:carbon-monoxide dehydrogenase large subunit